jgi:uncharacterized protein involved in response to NO
MSKKKGLSASNRGGPGVCCEECAKEGKSGPQPLALNLQPTQDNPSKYPVTPWSAQRLYRPFVRWALVIGILFGFATGAGMLVMRLYDVPLGIWWVTHAQGHGVAQIFGFAGLFTMGMAFHIIPRFRNGPMTYPVPQRIILTGMVIGIVLRFGGQSVSSHAAISGPIVVVSAVLMLIAIVGFAVVAGRALSMGTARRDAVERWLAVGIAWLLAAGLIQLAISIRMAADQSVIAYGPWNRAFIIVGLLGFLGSFIFGVSSRTVTGFLGLRQRHGPLEVTAFALFNFGVAWTVIGSVAGLSARSVGTGTIVMAAGVVAFVLALRILEPAETPRKMMPGSYARYTWFIRAAYVWVLVFAGLSALDAVETLTSSNLLPGSDAKPAIHVLTLGFITPMIVGMASRMIPLFEGSIIRGHRLLDFAWVALMFSVGLRVVFGFVRTGADAWLAISGLLGFAAICIFAVLLLNSITHRSRQQYRRAAAEAGRVRWKATNP